jgi:hypothetical protein
LEEGNRMGRKSVAVIPDSIIILLSIAIFLGQSGCAHMPKLPSEEMRAQFGKIGIVSVPSTPKIQFYPEFAKGRLLGASKGASMGTGAGALYGLSFIGHGGSCSGQGCAAVLVVAAASAAIGGVAGGVAGGVKGAVDAVPKKEAQRIEDMVKNAFEGIDIQKTMALSVYKTSLELPNYTFVPVEEEDFVISTPLDFGFFNERGINTVLELNVKGGGFKEGRGKNPSIALFMKVHARLIRAKDGREIYSREFEYKSSKHSSTEWFDMDARLLRDEIENSFRELPRQIVEELFGGKSL